MKKTFWTLCFFIFYSQVLSFAKEQQLSFYVSGLLSRPEVRTECAWSEAWFGRNSSFVYDHDIARIACLFSDVSYTDVLSDEKQNVLIKNYRLLGIKDRDIEFSYDLDYDDVLWGNDQCAFSIASKEIESALGKRTLVFVVIRGTPLNANEWLSNLNLNDNTKTEKEMHEGFARAAHQVHTALISYLLRHKIDPTDAFLLITGHSRGAAVANLVAAAAYTDRFFKTEQVYAYTFATPNVTTQKIATDERYGYIWNIVNAEDVVPVVPLYRGNWTYRKFGHTLTLVNYWNIAQEEYDALLPRMNEYFSLLSGRDFCPFKTGPFIPVQITEVFNSLNSSVNKFYSGFGLHKTGKNIFNKIFSSPAVKNESDEEEEDAERSKTILDRVTSWVNSKYNGLYSYVTNAFSDMHACESYLSWMLSLNKEELFSDLGYSQIILAGREEAAVLSKDGELLAKVMEGRVIYSSLKHPVAARPILPNKVVVGLPANLDFDVLVANESLISTPMTVTVEQYDSTGVLLHTGKKQRLYPHKNKMYSFRAGKLTIESDQVQLEKLRFSDSFQNTKNFDLKPQEVFHVSPEFSISTDLNIEFGLEVGNQIIYGVVFADFYPVIPGRDADFTLGIGSRQTLFGPFLLDFEARSKMLMLFSSPDDDERRFNLVPQLRAGLSVRPFRHASLFAAGLFEWHIEGFNDAAFRSDVRGSSLGEIKLNNTVSLVPALQFGLRF